MNNHEHHNMDHSHSHGGNESNAVVVKHSFKDFLPLIVIFAVIVAFTIWRASTVANADLMFLMTSFMGGFFIVFGGFKAFNLKGFAEAYGMYDVIAKRSKLYGYLYPFIEIGLGIAYLTAFSLLATNIVTLIIMLVGAYGVYLKLREKEVIPCACLGVVFKLPMTKVTLFEDLLMATMALVMIILLV